MLNTQRCHSGAGQSTPLATPPYCPALSPPRGTAKVQSQAPGQVHSRRGKLYICSSRALGAVWGAVGVPVSVSWLQQPTCGGCGVDACPSSHASCPLQDLQAQGSPWKFLGAAGCTLGLHGAQPTLVQRTVEHHVREDGDFQLLFRPAVLFRQFELFWRSQIFQVLQHFLYKFFRQQDL